MKQSKLKRSADGMQGIHPHFASAFWFALVGVIMDRYST